MINDRLIQRGRNQPPYLRVQTRDTVQRRSVDDREVQLVRRSRRVNKRVDTVNNPVRARAGTVSCC